MQQQIFLAAFRIVIFRLKHKIHLDSVDYLQSSYPDKIYNHLNIFEFFKLSMMSFYIRYGIVTSS